MFYEFNHDIAFQGKNGKAQVSQNRHLENFYLARKRHRINPTGAGPPASRIGPNRQLIRRGFPTNSIKGPAISATSFQPGILGSNSSPPMPVIVRWT